MKRKTPPGPPFKTRPFKTAKPTPDQIDCWCGDCDTDIASRYAARKHTETTGHTTRFEWREQRGFETAQRFQERMHAKRAQA